MLSVPFEGAAKTELDRHLARTRAIWAVATDSLAAEVRDRIHDKLIPVDRPDLVSDIRFVLAWVLLIRFGATPQLERDEEHLRDRDLDEEDEVTIRAG